MVTDKAEPIEQAKNNTAYKDDDILHFMSEIIVEIIIKETADERNRLREERQKRPV